MIRPGLVIAAAGGLPLAAVAQQPSFTSDSTITMHMFWREATTSGGTIPNPNGILEPGEHALIMIDLVSFTNQFGLANFSPPIGTLASGTIFGFGSGFVNIVGSGGTTGAFNISTPQANSTGTSGFGVRSEWRIAGNGTVNPLSDGITNLQFAQFSQPFNLNSSNPINNMYRFLWTPLSFGERTAAFNLAPPPIAGDRCATICVNLTEAQAYIYVPLDHITFGSVSIPIIPAPAAAAPLLLSAALLTPRRRP